MAQFVQKFPKEKRVLRDLVIHLFMRLKSQRIAERRFLVDNTSVYGSVTLLGSRRAESRHFDSSVLGKDDSRSVEGMTGISRGSLYAPLPLRDQNRVCGKPPDEARKSGFRGRLLFLLTFVLG